MEYKTCKGVEAWAVLYVASSFEKDTITCSLHLTGIYARESKRYHT